MNDTGFRQRPPASPEERSPALATEPPPLRDLFPILDTKTYLNSNSLGALSTRAVEERRRFEALWHELGASAWYEIWMGKLDAVRAALGRSVGAGAETIALMPSVSAGLAAVAGALDGAGVFDRRPRVVMTELDFPTVGHQFLSRRSLGVEVVVLESPDGREVPLEAFERAVDERTALVVTSHVFYGTGAIQDVAAISALARRQGAFSIIDTYQSTGQLVVDASAIEADFLVGGVLKWLCGGPGLGFLQVNSRVELAPTTLSWFGVEDQFGFHLEQAIPRAGGRRFELGTPAAGAAYTAAGGLSVLEEVGHPVIGERARSLADDLRARLTAAGYGLFESPEKARRSALVLIEHPDAASAVQGLARRDVIVDHRGSLVRFSPHFYNSVEDNERAVAALVENDYRYES